MAEVVGILASVAALVQLTSYGKKSARALYQFSQHAGISKADVERCANHLRTFSLAVRMAHETLREYSEDSSASSVFDFISSKQVLRAISIDSNSLKTRLSLAIKRFRNISKDGLTPVAFIKWWLHKDAITTLFPEMERIKTSLTLIIVTIQLKLVFTNIEKASSNSLVIEKLVQKMCRLKSSMKAHLDIMTKLEDQIERANQRMDSIRQIPTTPSLKFPYEALFQLGKSIAKTGDVPNMTSASSGSSASSFSTTKMSLQVVQLATS